MTYLAFVPLLEKGLGESPLGLNPPCDGGSPAGHHLQWRPQSLPDPQGQHGHRITIDLATQGFLRSALLQRSSTQLPTVFKPLA